MICKHNNCFTCPYPDCTVENIDRKLRPTDKLSEQKIESDEWGGLQHAIQNIRRIYVFKNLKNQQF